MSEKSYGVDYTVEVSYEDQALDILNSVNQALYDAGLKFQFVLEEEDQDPDIPSLFYSLLSTEDLIKE